MPSEETKLLTFYCPKPLLREMDALCEFNMIDRTEFILLSVRQLLELLESQKDKRLPAASLLPAGKEKEDALLASEDSEDA